MQRVFQISVKPEKAFRIAVYGVDSRKPAISSRKNLKIIIINIIYQQLASDVIFLELNKQHSSQLIKKLLINMLLSDY